MLQSCLILHCDTFKVLDVSNNFLLLEKNCDTTSLTNGYQLNNSGKYLIIRIARIFDSKHIVKRSYYFNKYLTERFIISAGLIRPCEDFSNCSNQSCMYVQLKIR